MKKVLVIEDDQSINKSLCLRLETAGFDVYSAFDAILGTSCAVQNKPDIAILDISMPGGNGFTVAERLKSNPETANMPFIFITASRQPELAQKAAALGAVGYFEKPYDPVALLEAVDDYV